MDLPIAGAGDGQRRLPTRVRVVEVGPRDGLQNEGAVVSTAAKVRLVNLLAATGIEDIEVTSFVSPHMVPQLADAEEVMAGIAREPRLTYWTLVPNMKGMERALIAGARAVAVFTGATDSFVHHNIGMTVMESLAAFVPVTAVARQEGVRVRGYISVCFGCPYEGRVAPEKVYEVARRLRDLGCDELALGDTIGVGTPNQVEEVVGPILDEVGATRVGLHLHDTRGTALANVLAALQLGVATFDASVAGLGGCPYAPGASGNLATEDLLYMLHGMGIETGIDLPRLCQASRYILSVVGHAGASRYLQAEGHINVAR